MKLPQIHGSTALFCIVAALVLLVGYHFLVGRKG